MLVNQSLWSEFDAVEELSEQAAETISGGGLFTPFGEAYADETFTIKNQTGYTIPIVLDGTKFTTLPYESAIYTTHKYGTLSFDSDIRPGIKAKTYNLADGSVYAFQNNKKTPGNPYDLDIYKIA